MALQISARCTKSVFLWYALALVWQYKLPTHWGSFKDDSSLNKLILTTVEGRVLIAEAFFTGAQRAKVLSGLGGHVRAEGHENATFRKGDQSIQSREEKKINNSKCSLPRKKNCSLDQRNKRTISNQSLHLVQGTQSRYGDEKKRSPFFEALFKHHTSCFAANGNVEVHVVPRLAVCNSFGLFSIAFFLSNPR